MLDIALFSATPVEFGGGFETFLISLRDYARRRGYAAEIITPPARHFFRVVRLLGLGTRFKHVAASGAISADLAELRNARSIYVKNEILDLAWLRSMRIGNNLTIGFHTRLRVGSPFRDALYGSRLYGALTARAKLHFLRRESALLSRYAGRHVAVIPNGVPFGSLAPIMAQALRPIRFLYVGRLSHEKGPDRLEQALSSLRAPWRLHIVGDGPLETLARDWARRDGRVTATGRLTKAATMREYADADFLLLPSRWENVPFAVLEAVAAGVVPLASDLPEIREILGNFPTCIVDFERTDEFQARISKMLDNDGRLYAQTRASLHADLQRAYSEEHVYCELVDFLLEPRKDS